MLNWQQYKNLFKVIQGASGKHGFERQHSLRRIRTIAERAVIEDSRLIFQLHSYFRDINLP